MNCWPRGWGSPLIQVFPFVLLLKQSPTPTAQIAVAFLELNYVDQAGLHLPLLLVMRLKRQVLVLKPCATRSVFDI